jgi:hypothetical protein
MIEIAGSPNELVTPRNDAVDATHGLAALDPLHRSCLAVLRAEWSTLALVSAGAGAPVRSFARALVEAARTCRLRPVKDLSVPELAASQIPPLADALAARDGDSRAVVAVEDPLANPACAPLLMAAEAVLLVVRLGVSEFRPLAEIVELAGRERVIGCVVAT